MAFSLTSYSILTLLAKENKTAILASMSIADMLDSPDLDSVSQATLYSNIDMLLGSKLIARGVKVKTANTFYITEAGLKHLADATGLTIEELKGGLN